MYEKTRVLIDGNDRVTILTVLDQVTHNSNNPQTVIDPSTLKNAIPGFTAANFRLTFLSAQWCFDNQIQRPLTQKPSLHRRIADLFM
jgi:hypothetical protein